MFIYPLAMTLILLVLVGPLFKQRTAVYRMTTYFTLIASIFDGLNACPNLSSKPLSFKIFYMLRKATCRFQIGDGVDCTSSYRFCYRTDLEFR